MEKFVEHIEEEVKRLYAIFPQQPMIELTDVLKREHEAAEKCHICVKSSMAHRILPLHRFISRSIPQ